MTIILTGLLIFVMVRFCASHPLCHRLLKSISKRLGGSHFSQHVKRGTKTASNNSHNPFVLYISVLVIGSVLVNAIGLSSSFMLPVIFFLIIKALHYLKGKYQLEQYKKQLVIQLPHFLDLWISYVHCGLDLNSGLSSIPANLPDGALKTELLQLKALLNMGKTSGEALKHLADKFQLEAFYYLAFAIQQSEKLGSSVTSTLDSVAQELQSQIYSQAEMEAQKVPLKMMLPLIGLIFPVTFIIIFAPIFLSFVSSK